MENVMNETVNEQNVETENPDDLSSDDLGSKTLCSVIPLMICRFPFNPNIIDWENSNIDNLDQSRKDLLNARYALITSQNINEIQKLQTSIESMFDDIMTKFGLDRDYVDTIEDINKRGIRNYPSEFRHIILVSDMITIYDWILMNLKYYREMRKTFTQEKSTKKLMNIVYSGETFDPINDMEKFSEMDVEQEELQAEMVQDAIVNDNNQFINNPDNISEADLRSIINSFNDDHSVSGLLD